MWVKWYLEVIFNILEVKEKVNLFTINFKSFKKFYNVLFLVRFIS